MPELTIIDALSLGVKHSIGRKDYGQALIRLKSLREEYTEKQDTNPQAAKDIDELIGTITVYVDATRGKSQEEYLTMAEPFLQAIDTSYFTRLEEVCCIDGKTESVCRQEDFGFNPNVEGTPLNLCARHGVDYQVNWRPQNSPVKPDVKAYAREANPGLYELLMTYSE